MQGHTRRPPQRLPQRAVRAQALVDRPDMVRKQINFKRLVLTDFKIEIPRLAKKKVLSAALEESGAPPHRAPSACTLYASARGLRCASATVNQCARSEVCKSCCVCWSAWVVAARTCTAGSWLCSLLR